MDIDSQMSLDPVSSPFPQAAWRRMKSVMSFEMRRLVGPLLGACGLVGAGCSPEAPLGRAGKAGAGGSGVEAGVPEASTGGAGGSGGDLPDVIIVPRDVGAPPPPC